MLTTKIHSWLNLHFPCATSAWKTITTKKDDISSTDRLICRAWLPLIELLFCFPQTKKIFTWYEGTTTTNDLYSGRLSLLKDNLDYGKASVNLTAIRESDQGRYHCQIMFPNRTPSIRNNGTFYHLVVEGGSLIKIPPVNQTIMEGQTAFFHCTMKYPETSTIVWSKDGIPLHDIQEVYRRSYFGPEGSLSIDPTMMSDLGQYECSVRNNDGEIQTSNAYLNIQCKSFCKANVSLHNLLFCLFPR